MNVRHPKDVLHSFPIKKIFYEKIDLKVFYFLVMISMPMISSKIL